MKIVVHMPMLASFIAGVNRIKFNEPAVMFRADDESEVNYVTHNNFPLLPILGLYLGTSSLSS